MPRLEQVFVLLTSVSPSLTTLKPLSPGWFLSGLTITATPSQLARRTLAVPLGCVYASSA
jgi:hypothetical protein